MIEKIITNLLSNAIKYTAENEKITFTPIFIEAVSKAIKDFPMINVSVDGNTIVVHQDINIGMATALPTGNLIVSVVKNKIIMKEVVSATSFFCVFF